MNALTKGIVVALIQVLIVCSLGAKLLYDRHTRPQAWFRTAQYDPSLPIRGRYLSLQIDVKDPRPPEELEKKLIGAPETTECGSIVVRDGAPVAVFDESATWSCDNLSFTLWKAPAPRIVREGDTGVAGSVTRLRLNEPLFFFIPDAARDPGRLARGEELWVLATIPRKGPPRPIALGIKKAGESNITRVDSN